ncbi:MAG: TIGR02281 family clan AA aspartic protease [Planctomycetes bacterium]|nr:TIGR02281 family clan AA aspartic protease [Planctomycetota bacterium]MBI3845769.1 TIGR02281 family clan AA aspartic protease [Planctomycetota bacterium]
MVQHRDAVLRLRTYDRDGKPFRSIAAVLVGLNGEAVTSYRYLLGAATASVEAGGSSVSIETVLAEDPAIDVVIVEIPSPHLAAPIAPGGAAVDGALTTCAALGPKREETPALGIGALGRALRDPESGTTRLPYHGLAAAEGAALLDLDGGLIGYVLPGIESASPRFAIPASEITTLRTHPTRLALADWNRARFEGSAEAHLRTAELDLSAGRFAAAISEFRAAVALDGSLESKVSPRILDAFARWERAARDAGDLDEALHALEESVQAFPSRGELRLRLARAYLERRRFRDAIGAFASSMTPDADEAQKNEALEAMADAYSRWTDGLYLTGALDDALAVLDEGLRAFPNSAPLRLLRGRILLDRKQFGDAYAELEAAALLSPDLESQVAPLLDAARRALGGGPTVELHFTPGSTVIPADVVVNGRERIVMQVDTGAGITAISPVVARRLGYDTGPGARVEPVRTASGVVNAAVVTLQSVNVKGLVVRNLSAYVLELPGSSGLLGLNFLNQFRYSVEPGRGVLTLQAR